MLFSAFEKHQYYNIKDLVDITKQPVVRPPGAIRPTKNKKTQLSICFFPSSDLPEGNSAGYWHLQLQRNSQEYLGAQARIQTLSRRGEDR